MKLGEGIFAVKLYELERQYAKLQSRLHICQQEDHGKIKAELARLRDEYRQWLDTIERSLDACRTPAVREFAGAQLDYGRQAQAILQEASCPETPSETSLPGEDEAEAATLYAEYAIDFATLSMENALLAAMTAIDKQMTCEEMNHKKEKST